MKIIECPRDAMQGLPDFIATEQKVEYINALLQLNFDTIDFGSFVSPKAIPQMADTAKVVEQLDLTNTTSKLLAIIANERGAQDAVQFEQITYLGFPFSVSETFQQRNTNASREQAFERIQRIQDLCLANNKQLVVYLSMAFGNPYEDAWHPDIVCEWAEQFAGIDVKILSLADTVGVAQPKSITDLFTELIPHYTQVEFGAHFHSNPNQWEEKIDAAVKAGCQRFDTSLNGIGGCPMAKDELVGNIATENVLAYFATQDIDFGYNEQAMPEAQRLAQKVFQ